MRELSKMQGLAGGSRAPLGLLLVCLSLPGLFARSIGAPEEKISPQAGKPSFDSLKLGTADLGQPQPKPDPANNELPRALPRLAESPPDGALPEEDSEELSQPSFWEGSPTESWFYEDPQPGMEAAAEDRLEQVLPETLPYLSRGSPGPVAFSATEASEDSEPDSSALRTEAEDFAQHPFWFLFRRSPTSWSQSASPESPTSSPPASPKSPTSSPQSPQSSHSASPKSPTSWFFWEHPKPQFPVSSPEASSGWVTRFPLLAPF
ncbi:uncharacterized protein C6orf15 homolog isoform X2 [Cricetulus griseus]|uniref:Uncharacterized protein C6orf15 homolog isoform X2 n=1 Tax=Cricetulus griseus TaxID=10029 RepID=A0A061IHE4_CRIGR|nr:uncharacterized protein C6orf15 homolog isoform X2 [Cricetulus griseus]XP_027244423.2 uncharacterized protein C6orf15 homolog isoform X2 [Cricetulus griseus]ERE88296.1 hypothetical protein H671_1g3173 [Cricetulus griseus]